MLLALCQMSYRMMRLSIRINRQIVFRFLKHFAHVEVSQDDVVQQGQTHEPFKSFSFFLPPAQTVAQQPDYFPWLMSLYPT
jgi:hypothetical protein